MAPPVYGTVLVPPSTPSTDLCTVICLTPSLGQPTHTHTHTHTQSHLATCTPIHPQQSLAECLFPFLILQHLDPHPPIPRSLATCPPPPIPAWSPPLVSLPRCLSLRLSQGRRAEKSFQEGACCLSFLLKTKLCLE